MDKVESFLWLGIVVCIVHIRFISRIMHLGSPKNLQFEDVIMALVLGFYCVLIAGLFTVDRLGTNEMPPDSSADNLSPSTISDLRLGSKWVIVTEQMWLATIWGCKVCLLLFYNGMTSGVASQHRLVLLIGIFCGVSYLTIEIFFFAVWCHPFQDYWSVPPTTKQCSVYTNHLVLVLVLNVVSDIMMMPIPLSILIQAQLSLAKKLTLSALFSLGIFVIICCCMSKYYSLSDPYGIEWLAWYVREASVAVIVANIPLTWPLLRRMFNTRSFFPTVYSPSRRNTQQYASGNQAPIFNRWRGLAQGRSANQIGSQEYISNNPLQIWERKEFEVTEEAESEMQRSPGSRQSSNPDYPMTSFSTEPRTTTIVTSAP